MAFVEAGHEVIQKLVEDLGDIATIEKLPEMDGRFMVAVFSPKQQDKKKGSKKVKEENPKEA
jgi:translation initiation factor IF-3